MRHGVSRRDPAKETFWRERIAEHTASGLSVREFCRRHDLKEVAFYWWRRELGRRDAEAQAGSFVPVHVTDDPAPDGGGQIEIELTDGRRIRVTGTVNREMLAQVLDVLERRAC